MKILIVNTSDILGGAARAAYRLHKGLLTQGVDSHMFVQFKYSDDYTVIGPKTNLQKAINRLRPKIDTMPVSRYPERSKTLFSSSWFPSLGVIDKINAFNPDIVHLHWIGYGMIRIEDLSKINAPIVWSLHDNWAFTGGCHIKWNCDRYKHNCGFCPRLASNIERDLSRKIWLRKKKTFMKLPKMKIIGLSNWMANCAKESSLFKNHEVLCLPNPINTKIYYPFDKDQARILLNLPKNKKLIGFGAISATNDLNKGFKQLEGALNLLPTDYELVVFGSSKPNATKGFKQMVYYLGHLHDDVSLRALYSAVDVIVVPSLQENLSNVIMESLACGTPVVGFSVGGNTDLIEHKRNGYLAEEYDERDLSFGIEWVLSNNESKELSLKAVSKVQNNFSETIVIKKYIKQYKELLY